jgi:hypothetical protein
MAKITRLLVAYEKDTADGSELRFISLPAMRQAVRAERLTEILNDLAFACQDALARSDGPPPAVVGLRRIK